MDFLIYFFRFLKKKFTFFFSLEILDFFTFFDLWSLKNRSFFLLYLDFFWFFGIPFKVTKVKLLNVPKVTNGPKQHVF